MKIGTEGVQWLTECLPESRQRRSLRLADQQREALWRVRQEVSKIFLGNRSPVMVENREDYVISQMAYGNTTFSNLVMGGALLGDTEEVTDVYFSFCVFVDCKLDNIRFKNCTFVGAVFKNVEFGRVIFEDCIFNEGSNPELGREENEAACLFVDCLFRGRYQGEWLAFQHCDLRWTVFERFTTENIIFRQCNLSESIFEGCHLRGFKIDGCKLTGQMICRSQRLDIYFYNGDQCAIDENFFADYEVLDESYGVEMSKSLRRVAHLCSYHHRNDQAAEYVYRAQCIEERYLKGTSRLGGWCLRVLCGYGERPSYTFYIIVAHNFFFALLYLYTGISTPAGTIDYALNGVNLVTDTLWVDYLKCLFFSITTFTTVGYGNFLPIGVAGMVVTSVQMMLGLFLCALWTGCVLRKIAR